MPRVEKTVFISYRRTDVYTALAVYQDLSSKGYDVFFDYTSISSGDFEQIILSNIKARAHFLLILTPTALDRVNEPGDWLRREIETAIDEQRNIIPLFFKGFNFGASSVVEKLTGKLSTLPRYNGMNVHEDYFRAAMDRLSEQFLNVPLTTILHPLSTEVRKAVKEEQHAVNDALVDKWEDLKEFFKSAEEKTTQSKYETSDGSSAPSPAAGRSGTLNARIFGIGAGILLIIVLGFISTKAWLSGNSVAPTMTSQAAVDTVIVTPTLTSLADTFTPEIRTSTPTEKPTMTATLSPTLGPGSTKTAKDGMAMVFVPEGTFQMGNNKGEADEYPAHNVYLDAFWIDQTEVTNTMYLACIQAGKCQENPNDIYLHKPDFKNHPIVFVDWYDAANYCSWVGKRLPTEAEWEKAASWDPQKQTESIYPWGNNLNCSFANYYESGNKCVGTTTAVGTYAKGKSPYGAFDMAGNAREWVNDWYQSDYYDILGDSASNPTGPENGELRVIRGGSWHSFGYDARSSDRYGSVPTQSRDYVGFRCAMPASQ